MICFIVCDYQSIFFLLGEVLPSYDIRHVERFKKLEINQTLQNVKGLVRRRSGKRCSKFKKKTLGYLHFSVTPIFYTQLWSNEQTLILTTSCHRIYLKKKKKALCTNNVLSWTTIRIITVGFILGSINFVGVLTHLDHIKLKSSKNNIKNNAPQILFHDIEF